MALFCGGLGLVLGLWQTLSESIQGTWLFLLHRPIARRSIILSKLAAGLILTVTSTALPLLIYLIWAMTPETHASPFELWMTFETVAAWFVGPMFFLAAFLCGLRDARWYASRLWPLIPVFVIGFLIAQDALPFIAPYVWITLIFDVIFVGAIVHAAKQRDYA